MTERAEHDAITSTLLNYLRIGGYTLV
jgi:hypothetical protein